MEGKKSKGQKPNEMTTKDQIKILDEMFKFYNRELFGGKLVPGIIGLTKSGPKGAFLPSRWKIKNDSNPKEHQIAHHEINININKIGNDNLLLHATLVSQMVLLWQEDLGKPGKTTGWHNLDWANKMEMVGLMPSKSGKEGGQKTGWGMDFYILDEGKFINSFNKIKDTTYLPFMLQEENLIQKSKSSKSGKKATYGCQCGNKIWGKSGLAIQCKKCKEDYMEV